MEQKNMCSLLESSHDSPFASKYQLLKLKSKYIIMDILSYAGYREQAIPLLACANRKFRDLIVQQFDLFLLYSIPDIKGIDFNFQPVDLVVNGLTTAALRLR